MTARLRADGQRTHVSEYRFGDKQCTHCHKDFRPNSGVQKMCELCRGLCRKCMTTEARVFRGVCGSCADLARRQVRSQRPQGGSCLDCGVKIHRYRLRCKKHAAIESASRRRQPKPNYKRRFPYNGTDYRSTWEVETAQLLDEMCIAFVYEQYHVETRTHPDFYIIGLDLYLEIHPRNFGSKRLPTNSVLVESKSAIKAAVLQLHALLEAAA